VKLLFVVLFAVFNLNAGEIADAYYKASAERSVAATKKHAEALKQIEKEPELAKRIELLSTHPDLKVQLPTAGDLVVFTNNGLKEIAHVSTNHGVSEFGLERSGFTFIARSDGTCRYTGRVLPIPQKRRGIVSMVEFHRIAQFIKEMNYFQMQDNYDSNGDDFPTAFSTVVMDGERKTIRNYGDAAPSRLWALEQLIDGMVAHARWETNQ
jgi:hypothetical protein